MIAATLIAMALSLQEADPPNAADVEQQIERLGNESLDVREEAMRRLVALGEAVVPRIEQLARSSNPEERRRAMTILVRIRQMKTLRGFLPEPSRITLDLDKTPLKDVLASLARQSGEKLEAAEEAASLDVTVHFRDLTLWDALDRLCRSDADLTYGFEEEVIRFTPGPRPEYPAVRRHGLAVWLDGLTLTETHDFSGNREESFTVGLNAAWPRNVKPTTVELKLEEVADEDGSNLIMRDRRQAMTSLSAPKERHVRSTFQGLLQVPAKESTRLARIRGSLRMTFPLEFEEAVIPLNQDRPSVIMDGVTIAVQGLRNTRNTCTFQLMITQPAVSAGGQTIQVTPENAMILDGDGREYPVTSATQSSAWSDGQRFNYYNRIHVTLPEGHRATRIRIRVQKRWLDEELPFDFKDVPLPPRS